MGALVPLLETTWPWSDLSARPCLASAASERHFSPGSPEETPLHTMLFLPAAALCWLGSAMAAMATQLVQDLTLTRITGQSVSFSCGETGQCGSTNVYWYQKKETETFKIIFRYHKSSCANGYGYNHPQKNDFSAEKVQNGCSLKIQNVREDHSASYYCGCVKSGSDEWIFGSGTKLFVTGDPVVKPMVSVYPAASSARRGRRGFLLCLASGMFPPEVKFTWKTLEDDGEKDLTSEEQLELREPNRTASILLVDRDLLSTSRYRCSVQHEGGPVEAPTTQEVCPWILMILNRVKLLCLLYSVLIVKSLVYCSGLSLLMVLRNKGPAPR
ncbi:uncharacterized protein LOC111608885 [Xiphophorus maculatus]|uniref:uncharacterized protein LOC111608885 n=1 Tax=Xiphophorus maculatus TaxID=8083 RepID=UPI000C6D8C63|nr:uncharacterized protein LOC111608885 [Xiphophorus maculatus]